MDFLFHLPVNQTIDGVKKQHNFVFPKNLFFFFNVPQICIYIYINV